MLTVCQNITSLLQVAEHCESGNFASIEQEYPQVLNRAQVNVNRSWHDTDFAECFEGKLLDASISNNTARSEVMDDTFRAMIQRVEDAKGKL